MATDALRSQVATKWQESFSRLNRDSPGISGLLNFSEAWTISIQFLYPRNIRIPQTEDKDIKTARTAFDLVSRSRRLPALLEHFLEDIRLNFHLIEKEIDQHMLRSQGEESAQVIQDLVDCLMEWYRAWTPPQDLGSTIFSAYTLNFQTRLFSSLPETFSQAFKSLCASLLGPPDHDSRQGGTSTWLEHWCKTERLEELRVTRPN